MMRPPPSSTRTYTLLPSTTRFRSILRLERQVKDKGKDLARNITVEQVRELKGRLNFSLSLGDWRVIVVDAIDDLEPGAANAFLMTLEEPPAKRAEANTSELQSIMRLSYAVFCCQNITLNIR